MSNSRDLRGRILLGLKGIAMGAADVVPGVSGGTIAFITGIYEELISSISGIGINTWRTFRRDGFKAAWKQANASFLINLLVGIIIAIVSLAKLISFLLEEFPIPVWAFFFGLIIASIFIVGKQVRNRFSATSIIGFIAGTIIAYLITIISPVSGDVSIAYVFFCGMLAITAMILPGISGSFILLLLGAYSAVLGSISGFTDALGQGDSTGILHNGKMLLSFAGGCIIGLLSFSRLLNWMFKKAHDLTISILTGFLLGSLNKIWPWKVTEEYFVKHEGTAREELVPLVEHNVLPFEWANINQSPSHLGMAIGLCLLGLILILLLDRWSPKTKMS
jgi:putative membrane protein